MYDISQLPLTVKLVDGESASSLASRLARRNGAPRMLTFCSDLGLNHKALANGEQSEIVRLTNLASCDQNAVLFWTPKFSKDGYFKFGKEKLKFTCFDRTHVRACPECIANGRSKDGAIGPAHLGIWQLTSIRTCHRHQCMLIDLAAPENRSEIFDYVRILDHVGSGATARVRQENQTLESWFLSRLEQGVGSNWLDGLPIHVALQTCENFGLLVAFGPQISRSKITQEQWLKAGAAGFEILRHGPAALTDTLKSIQRQTPVDSRQYRERYKIFFLWLRDRNSDPAFDEIRDLVREFIWGNFPVPKDGLVLGKRCPKQYIHTSRTASKAFNVSSWKIEQRLVQLGFAENSASSRRPVMMEYPNLAMMERVVRDIRNLWNGRNTRDFLGVEPATLLLLVKAKWLVVEMKLGAKAPYYNSGKVKDFLWKLRAQTVAKSSGDDDIAPLTKAAARCQCSLGELLHVIREERLTLVADDPQKAKFHDFRVSLTDIKNAAAAKDDAAYTLSKAAELLNTDTKTVRALINSHHLSVVSPFSKIRQQRWRIISRASVAEFDKQFISLKALSKLRGQMPNSVSQQLAKIDIRPLALPPKTQRIFRRCDIY